MKSLQQALKRLLVRISILAIPIYLVYHVLWSAPPHQSSKEYYTLIDLPDFKYETINMVCNAATLLLVLVHTAPPHFENRKVIRETWGRKRHGMSLAFVLGGVANSTLQEELLEENKQFKDLVRGNFLDSYKNLSYKLIAGLKYAKYHCPEAEYVLKIDDDMFVKMEDLIEKLDHFKKERLILGFVVRKPHVIREKDSKFYMG